MNKTELCGRVRCSAEAMGIALPEAAPEQFYLYYQMIEEANGRMNLTRVLEPEEAVDRHFMDSLAPLALGWMDGAQTLCDVGTGAGFPGVPILIARPDVKAVLLDSLNKRLTFLQAVLAELGLQARAKLVHARAEDGGRMDALRGGFDVALTRAVAPAAVALEWTIPFLKVGGASLLYKGAKAEEELSDAQHALSVLHARAELVHYDAPWGARYVISSTQGSRVT